MSDERTSLGDQIRHAVIDSGISQYRLCEMLGITKGPMSRFMSGKAGLTLKHLDMIADLLDLNITVGPKGKARKGR